MYIERKTHRIWMNIRLESSLDMYVCTYICNIVLTFCNLWLNTELAIHTGSRTQTTPEHFRTTDVREQ